MTGKQKRPRLNLLLPSLNISPFHLEMKKSSKGAAAVISGIMSIIDYSEERITLLTHSGRVSLSGEYLTVTVLENRIIEIYGIIEGVQLFYGKA